MPRRLLALTAASALLLATAACGSDEENADEPAGGTPTGSLEGVTATGEVGEGLDVELESPLDPEKPEAAVLTEGEGATLELNGSALLHLYVGNGTSGEQAANTYSEGPPTQVNATEGQLFDVLLEELVGQSSGSRVAIAAPVSDVWGEEGAPQLNLGAEDTVVFVADIVSVQPEDVLEGPEGTEADPSDAAPALVEEDGQITGFDWSDAPKKAPTELTVIPLIEGDGPEAKAESMVTFDYFGAVYGEEKPFDESFSREPVPFGIGVGSLIPAWDKAIPGLKQGSRVLIIAPPSEGYGDADQPGIPANSTLVFVVDVLGVDA